MNKSRIIVALDYADADTALSLADKLAAQSCRLKVGKELFCRAGPQLVQHLIKRGFDVFLDLKFHDIPNTVAQACAAAADLGVWMVNVHALGGAKMMEAARSACAAHARPPLLIGVTILTSLGDDDIRQVGLTGTPAQNVLRLATLAKNAGLDGVVCSPLEAVALRQTLGQEFCLVTPGIRPQGSGQDDQKRTMTPAEAVHSGADYLVIGRPITAARDPMLALQAIQQDIADIDHREITQQ
ncbi:MAG TPA: orotidine-5'-phosphate decarboxylase [Gammaproteobacteria bacterium]|nr:orotidine-5'-phosphate decarboxylase [Gammaproteobacteria bacterium]